MPIEIIQQPKWHEVTEYRRCFWYPGYEGSAGFTFECDKDGFIDLDALAADKPQAFKNWQKAAVGIKDGSMVDGGVECSTIRWKDPRVGRCPCGEEVVLDRFTNTCAECGADYNQSGQRLAPRDQWGEETGENYLDVLAVDYDQEIPF